MAGLWGTSLFINQWWRARKYKCKNLTKIFELPDPRIRKVFLHKTQSTMSHS